MTGWRTPDGGQLPEPRSGNVIDMKKGEGRMDKDDDDLQRWTPLNTCVVMVFATLCALVLHWAGVL